MKILCDWHFSNGKTESQKMYLSKGDKKLRHRPTSLPKFMFHNTTVYIGT